MAAWMGTMLGRAVGFSTLAFRSLGLTKVVFPRWSLVRVASLPFSTAENQTDTAVFDTLSRYKERPWEYLESEEYIERYGSHPVWADYRRNHKGGIPPQKTRKTCIRGGKVCGNPCPICRDQKLQIDYRNVKLLEQFMCPHTGIIYHPTRTGVCMKQSKKLTKAIESAQDHGLLSFRVPFMEFKLEEYSNDHGAVTKTPPPPSAQIGAPWYPWYDWQEPPEKKIARIRKIYKPYLKAELPPPVSCYRTE
ncbi:28S ribosomal protein S18b, mitochondrial isoform X2 [Latimeria chalumnae]|uniref:28S ribosomal protein S18b, mitochondrial isoform X2 n=1 Tax=Latimeria chalumnae TaxID=7897 RepID=UPI0003C159F2|nr:PREDICTED: 28S ribosomal protein S18b, mitochondrial isoform X2 [Latimeria chalumnae]|eukprot:XP_006011869.1 PREDICTED: 28S ribosomal protein S18b, mitochondrial isoform X2 [Latimeria chalumnae]